MSTRRDFIKKTGLTAAGAAILPTILPSGRLFAASGNRSADYVVLVMFAGGVRHQESVGKRYLADAQPGQSAEGNLMYNMLTGAAPSSQILYGTGDGSVPIEPILPSSLQSQGTLFNEVHAFNTGHYGALNSILQGAHPTGQGLRIRPVAPTIFEYLRRHGGYAASDVWFVGNSVGASIPLLNYSSHPDYGVRYGANFFAPTITFHPNSQTYIGDMKTYHPESEWAPMLQLKTFLDSNFSLTDQQLDALGNTTEEKENIKLFMKEMNERTNMGTIDLPPSTDSGDTFTMGYAVEVLKWFKPAFLCVNLNDVDVCHNDFTTYIKAMHRADHAVGHLWNSIQQIPEMAGNTTLICIPECGRNAEPNAIVDSNGFVSFDHSDENARRIFALMAGPTTPANLVLGSEGASVGQVSDAMMTVADLLGVKEAVQQAGYIDPSAQSFFDLI
jgi:hypothetical protein